MADEGSDETRLAERINRHKRPTGDKAERRDRTDSKTPDDSAPRPMRDRRVHPESGGREPERDY